MNHATPRRSRILTLHPDPLIRAGIACSLRGEDAFESLEGSPETASRDDAPIDVVIADLPQALRLAEPGDPGAHGLATARILVLTSSDREVDIRRAFAAGVHGYVLLGGPLNEFVEGVAALARGGRYLGRVVAERMADGLTHVPLTSRESEVLQLMVDGECNKDIARQLQVEVGTVKTHVSAIFGKLSARSRTQAAAIAINRGLVAERRPMPSEAIPRRVLPRVQPVAHPT